MSYPLTPPNPEQARAVHAALLEVERAAREVDKCLNSDAIFEEMREVWGNTNTYIWRRAIQANGAALARLDEVRGQAHNGVKEVRDSD